MFGRTRILSGGRIFGRFSLLILAYSATLFFSTAVLAEGSAQLGPWQALKDFSKGRTLRTLEASSMYVDILESGEIIHVALCGAENTDSLAVKIFDPYGTEVFDSGRVNADPGCANGATPSSNNSLSFETTQRGAYRLELENYDGLQFRYFDVSVATDRFSLPDENTSGRLWELFLEFELRFLC